MKLLILTCLVAVALARFPLTYCFTNIVYLLFFIPKEYINGMNRQRKVLREKQSDEIKFSFLQQSESSTSSSSEVNNLDINSFCRLNKYNQLQLEQTHRMSENNHVQVPFQQLSQLAAYPYAVWYYPQIRQNLPFPPFSDISSPIIPENYEKTNVMLQWW
uniref:Alpha-S1-casein n=1 Tax=Cebus imitator TaxID=2715852 RepID=A0A2K5QU66_CEBIM